MLLAGTMPAAVQLDLLEAAAKSKDNAVAEKLKQWEARRGKSNLADQYIETLEGGDIARGKKVFFEKGSVACIRCHKVGGDQEVVGPNLAGVGAKRDRRYLLESIIMPNAHITEGFASVILKLKGNMTIGGILKGETENTITIADPNEGTETYEKSQIVSRTPGQSAMPDGFDKMMTKRELRDVIEFLSSLKDEKEKMEATPPADGHGK
jgi:quinoprotein glucose dehydrogenase